MTDGPLLKLHRDDMRENSDGTAPQAPRRLVGRPFARGQSGNPRGRPKVDPDVRAMARRHAPEAFARLVEFMAHPRPDVALRACEAVLDRAYGHAAFLGEPGRETVTGVRFVFTSSEAEPKGDAPLTGAG